MQNNREIFTQLNKLPDTGGSFNGQEVIAVVNMHDNIYRIITETSDDIYSYFVELLEVKTSKTPLETLEIKTGTVSFLKKKDIIYVEELLEKINVDDDSWLSLLKGLSFESIVELSVSIRKKYGLLDKYLVSFVGDSLPISVVRSLHFANCLSSKYSPIDTITDALHFRARHGNDGFLEYRNIGKKGLLQINSFLDEQSK